MPGERDNAKNNDRCTKARKATYGQDGQHQDVDRTLRGRVNQNDKTGINGESTSMVWPTLGSRTAKEQNTINDESEGSIAKHLRNDKLLYYTFIIQSAGERIFKIGEHLAK